MSNSIINDLHDLHSKIYQFKGRCKHGIEEKWENIYHRDFVETPLINNDKVTFCPECFMYNVHQVFELLNDDEKYLIYSLIKDCSDNESILYTVKLRGGYMSMWNAYNRDCHQIAEKYNLPCVNCYYCELYDNMWPNIKEPEE